MKDIEKTAQREYPDSMEQQKAYIKGYNDSWSEQGILEWQNSEDRQELEFYRALIDYLAEDHSINYPEFFESLAGEHEHEFVGKLHGTKHIDDNGDMYVEIKLPDNPIPFKAKWNFTTNYGVCQWTGAICDDYSGYIVLPTLLNDVFFVYHYQD